MQDWVKENKIPITVTLSAIGTIAIVLTVLLTSINSIHYRLDAQDRYIDQRFNAVNMRLDGMDKRLDQLTGEVSELRKLTVSIIERVSRNEGEINVIRGQIRAVDAPAP